VCVFARRRITRQSERFRRSSVIRSFPADILAGKDLFLTCGGRSYDPQMTGFRKNALARLEDLPSLAGAPRTPHKMAPLEAGGGEKGARDSRAGHFRRRQGEKVAVGTQVELIPRRGEASLSSFFPGEINTFPLVVANVWTTPRRPKQQHSRSKNGRSFLCS